MNDTQARLLTILNSYGDIVELDWKFDSNTIIQELKSVHNWIDGSNYKKGLPLTGSSEQLDLISKDDKEGEINDNLKKCPSLLNFFGQWNSLAKCHAVNMNSGSFFRLHRDAYKTTQQLRIFIPLNKTELHEFAFVYDRNIIELKPARAYMLNTKKQHGSFAMVDDIYHILMGIYVNPHNFRVVTDLLPNCIDHG